MTAWQARALAEAAQRWGLDPGEVKAEIAAQNGATAFAMATPDEAREFARRAAYALAGR